MYVFSNDKLLLQFIDLQKKISKRFRDFENGLVFQEKNASFMNFYPLSDFFYHDTSFFLISPCLEIYIEKQLVRVTPPMIGIFIFLLKIEVPILTLHDFFSNQSLLG